MIKQYFHSCAFFNPLHIGNPITGTFTNSIDPDEMPHNAAFHLGLYCL